MVEYIVECIKKAAIYMTKTEYNQIYNKNNYKQLNLKIPMELSNEFSNLKNEYGSAPKVLEASLNALKNVKNLQIENNNLQRNILELKSNLNTKKENNINENKLILEVVDENEKLKNEILKLKNYNAELKNMLNEKLSYNASENIQEGTKTFTFLIGSVIVLAVIYFAYIVKF